MTYLWVRRISRHVLRKPCLGPFQDAVLSTARVVGGKRARIEYNVSLHEYERWRLWARNHASG